MAAQIITKDYLNYLFNYKDGELYWKNKTSPFVNIVINQKAGCVSKDGYKKIAINKKSYGTHRIIFMMFNGYMPDQVDHKDNNPANNKIENLREATISQNMQNAVISKRNKSGIKGVNFHKASKQWIVRLSINNVRKYFGTYNDIDYAKFVADAMRYKYHGKFARG